MVMVVDAKQGIQGKQGKQGVQGETGQHTYLSKSWRIGLGLWMIVFSLATIIAWTTANNATNKNKELAKENRALIHRLENQQTILKGFTIDSCINTFQSFITVFQPFFPPKKVRTAKQEQSVKKFQDLIANKKTECKHPKRPK